MKTSEIYIMWKIMKKLLTKKHVKLIKKKYRKQVKKFKNDEYNKV